MSRKVTFRADGRVAPNYSPGHVYTETLTPYLEALLRNGSILILIDPLSLDEPDPAPVLAKLPEPKVEEKKFVPTPRPVQAKVEKDTEESDEDEE